MSYYRRNDDDHHGEFWAVPAAGEHVDRRFGRIVDTGVGLAWECSATYSTFGCGVAAFSTFAEARRVALARLRDAIAGQIDAADLASKAPPADVMARLRAKLATLEAAKDPGPFVAPVYVPRADLMAEARRLNAARRLDDRLRS